MQQAAHDLTNDLTVSNGHRQQADKHLVKALEHLRLAMQSDQRMMELTRRMVSGALSAPTGLFDINEVVCELAGAVQALGGSLRVDLCCYGEPARRLPIFASGDGLAMHRALFNLCINARTAGATIIRIETDLIEAEKKACIAVVDNGKGFRPSELIWKRPVSADGLHGHGLAIVKRTIDEHNGTVEVWSEPGETVFKILLPAVDPRAGQADSDSGTAVA